MKKLLIAVLSSLCVLGTVATATGCFGGDTPNNSDSSVTAKYTVTFHGGNGATGDTVTQTAEDGANITLPENTFSKEGYEFKCWTDGVNEYQEGALFKVEEDMAFTAVWTKTLVDFAVSAYPTASALTYGDKLSQSTLTGGAANIEGAFVWATPDVVPTVVNGGYNVKFVPADAEYGEVILEEKVQVTVNKKAVTEIAMPTATAITYGDKISASTLSGGDSYCTYAWANPNEVATACGTKEVAIVVTPNDDNYDFSGASLTGTVNVEVQKKALKVKATSIVAFGDDTPTIDAYDITYEGFIFEDDASVVTGEARLGETTYVKGAEGSIFYGELDVSGMSAENYEMQSMGADILVRVKLAFKAGTTVLYDYCEFGEQYEFKGNHDGLADYAIIGYTRGETSYKVGEKFVVDTWTQEQFVAKLAVELAAEELVFSKGAKLYYGLGDSTTYFDAINATLHYVGVYPNAIEWAYYRAVLKGVDYRNYNGLSFQMASNVALKLYMTDGSELLTMVGGQTYVFTAQKDGSIYIDGVDSGKDFVNGTIAFDMDRSASIYAELHVAKTMKVNGGESKTLAKEDWLIYGIQSAGNMFAGNATQEYVPQESETGFTEIAYQSQDIRKITLSEEQKDVEIAYYYEFAIANPKVNISAHEYTSFYIGINQGYHDLYCGGKFLATITSHQQVKISIDASGAVYLDDVSTGFAVDAEIVKFNIYLQDNAGWVSPYTTFYAGKNVSVEDYEVTALSAIWDSSKPVYANTTMDALKEMLTVKAQYDNGSEKAVSAYELSGSLSEGESVLTVTYKGQTTTVTVNVAAATPTGIVAMYAQGEDIVYETASLDDLKNSLLVKQTFSDGTEATVTEYTLSGALTVGESAITVTYGNYTATFTVDVTAVEIVSIAAEYTQNGEVYKSAALDSLKSGLVVTATYNNNETGVITDYTLSGALAIGESTITVTAGEATATFTVNVTAEVISLAKTDINLTAGAKLYYGINTIAAGSETPFNALQASLQYAGSGNTGAQVVHAYYRAVLKGVDYRNYDSLSFNVSSNVANLKLFTVDGTEILATLAKTAHKLTVYKDGSLYVDGVDTGKDMINGTITFDIDRSVNQYAAFYLSTATEAVGGDAVTIAKENLFITAIQGVGTTFERPYIDSTAPEQDTEPNIGYKMDSVKEISVDGTNLPASYYELKIDKTAVDYTKYDSVTFYLSINQGGYHELYCGGEYLGSFSVAHTQKKVTVMQDGTVYVDDVKTNAKLDSGELKFNILLVEDKEHTTSIYTQFKISDKVVTA